MVRVINLAVHPRPSSDAKHPLSIQAPTFFDIIPGEIRNQIFSLCISHALDHQKPPPLWQPLPAAKANGLMVAVHSSRSGRGYLKLQGIRPLPLLVVNKQIYNEVSSLVYALVDSVSIGSNISQYLDEDPNERWKFAYSLVEKRSDIQKLARSVNIVLPRTPDAVLRTIYDSLRKIPLKQQTPRNSNAMAIIPGLQNFLGKFESLTSLTIVFIADKIEIPNFEYLIPLYKAYGERMTVQFEGRSGEYDFRRLMFIDIWKAAWDKCLREHEERTTYESGARAG
jgi:hypothetical protein